MEAMTICRSKFPILIAVAFSGAIAGMLEARERKAPEPFRISGYLPDYRFAGFEPELAKGLTDLIVFSAELNADGTLDSKRIEQCPWTRLQELKKSTGMRLWLAIGGWERSEHFAAVAGSAEKRKICVDSISDFARERKLDGIDLDWEHPKNPDEERSYGLLLSDLRQAFEPSELQLSVTMAGWQKLHPTAIDAVDTVQIMAYDHSGPHSTFENSVKDVDTLKAGGVPVSKITLGVPFYGRHVQTREAMTYAWIVSRFDPAPNVDLAGNVYFNGPGTIRKKVRFAIDNRLAGIMIWEIGQDTAGEKSLLKSIREEAKGVPSK